MVAQTDRTLMEPAEFVRKAGAPSGEAAQWSARAGQAPEAESFTVSKSEAHIDMGQQP
jgi:hypothetical protein